LDFAAMMARLRNQSDMVVRQAEAKWTMEKIGDEGTSTPFIARIFMGLLRIREMVYRDPKERRGFDSILDQALSSLLSSRASAQQIQEMWKTHSEDVAAGKVAHVQGDTIHVNSDFNRRFQKEVNSFLYDAARTLKEGMQKVGRTTGREIGIMFRKPDDYQRGLDALRATDRVLAAYVQQTRNTWSERLIEARNKLDHKGWVLPRVTYEIRNDRVVVHEPLIDGWPAVSFVTFMIDRLSCFVEEFALYCFQSRLPEGIAITEIPMMDRSVEAPERFTFTLQTGGLPKWLLTYHASPFEES
jgi:hypothetical protein